MHVSLAIYSACFLNRVRHPARGPLLVIALFIFLSTLLTKQHYLADSISGALLAIGILQIVF
jgi:membrane-associated phospholipid phosphatase